MALLWIWLSSFTLFFALNGFAKSETTFKQQTIKVGSLRLKAEIAENEEQWQRGLMYRTHLDQDRGMLFIFPKEEPRSFWMKNTFIPLSIGYFDKNKKLLEVIDMEPVVSEMATPKSYPSSYPAKYALEVNLGWFTRNKIKIGSQLKLQHN